MTSTFQTIIEETTEQDIDEENQVVNLILNSEKKAKEKLKEYFTASSSHDIDADKFTKENKDKCIKKLRVGRYEELKVVEHAPKLFKLVRRGLKSDQDIMNSLIPALNYEAIHNFETGQGASPAVSLVGRRPRQAARARRRSDAI